MLSALAHKRRSALKLEKAGKLEVAEGDELAKRAGLPHPLMIAHPCVDETVNDLDLGNIGNKLRNHTPLPRCVTSVTLEGTAKSSRANGFALNTLCHRGIFAGKSDADLTEALA